jgi:hypothetical protein
MEPGLLFWIAPPETAAEQSAKTEDVMDVIVRKL